MARVSFSDLSTWGKIASRIRNTRKWRELTDVQASELLGIELKRYRKMERGKTEDLTVKEIVSMMKIFGTSVEEILAID